MTSGNALGDGRSLRTWVAALLALGLLAGSGCVSRHGRPAAVAVSPGGFTADVTLDSGWDLTGELLSVDPSGAYLLTARTSVSRVEWDEVSRIRIPDGDLSWRPSLPADPAELDDLRGYTRFPPGLSDQQVEALLRHHGQSEPWRASHGNPPSALPDTVGREAGAGTHARAGYPLADVEGLGGGGSDLVAAASRAAVRFASLDEAMLSGYRAIGPDLPGAGRHWVNAYLLMRGGLNPETPPFLTYVETPSGPELVGVALGRVLLGGESSADLPVAGAWHQHSGTVEEELLALDPSPEAGPSSHDMDEHAPGEGDREPRLTMLHIWTVASPEGPFALDNWALPFRRIGLPPPPSPDAARGRAAYLASGGQVYYRDLIAGLVSLEPKEVEAVDKALSRAGQDVRRWAEAVRRGGGVPSSDALVRLDDVWATLWRRIEDAVPSRAWAVIASLAS